LDSFTRNYSLGLGILVLVGFVLWFKSTWQPQAWELNRMLEADPIVAAYPYQFRVESFDNGVATILTPRSPALPAIQFVPILYPELAGKDQSDPAMIKAQADLVQAQKRAMDLVAAAPGVTSIDWALDRRWLSDHGVQAPTNPFELTPGR
jgi:hypothetical protein